MHNQLLRPTVPWVSGDLIFSGVTTIGDGVGLGNQFGTGLGVNWWLNPAFIYPKYHFQFPAAMGIYKKQAKRNR